jgi:hypothetical protein
LFSTEKWENFGREFSGFRQKLAWKRDSTPGWPENLPKLDCAMLEAAAMG